MAKSQNHENPNPFNKQLEAIDKLQVEQHGDVTTEDSPIISVRRLVRFRYGAKNNAVDCISRQLTRGASRYI